VKIPVHILEQIDQWMERAYPEEGAGFLLGHDHPEREVEAVLALPNTREEAARRNRYLIGAQEMLEAEREAERLNLDVIGVYHSHPDHPSQPSAYDLEWALPWFSYLIIRVSDGRADGVQSWRLREDRGGFAEEPLDRVEAGGSRLLDATV